MKIDLLYGKKGLTIALPEYVRPTIIAKYPMPPLQDPIQALRNAFENPAGSPSLREVAQGKKNACILICDITRPVPNDVILPPILDTLTQAGISADRILILVATGLHRPNEGEELKEVVGSEEIFNSIRIENHFARDREAHVDLGCTSIGTPILIDRRFIEADVKIVTGLVEPHFMAGYSGGRKVVAPGIAFQDTILRFHHARILEHCNAMNCVIEGNPLHGEQMEIVRRIGDIAAVNVVIDDKRRIGFVNFGEIEASHSLAVDFMRRFSEVKLQRRYKTVITTCAGYPLDKTYYQTIKGMVGAMDIVDRGGTIIIASECSEGMGSREFVDAQKLLCEVGPERFMSILKSREKARVDEWETEMLLKPLRVAAIKLFSRGLTAEDLKHVFVKPVNSVEEAVEQSIKSHGDEEIAVVPEGPYVIPMFDGSRGI